MYQFQPEPSHKIQEQQQKHQVKRYSPMEHLSNDHKDNPNQHKNSQKLCNKTRHPWKLRQHNQNFPIEGKPL